MTFSDIQRFVNSTVQRTDLQRFEGQCVNADGNNIVLGILTDMGTGNQALTITLSYVSPGGKLKNDTTSISEAITSLTGLYTGIITENPNIKSIYTSLNVESNEVRTVSHQNWIVYNVESNILHRIEPSVDYEEFNFNLFCNEVASIFNARVSIHILDINHDEMCKAYSSLITIYFIVNGRPTEFPDDFLEYEDVSSSVLYEIMTKLNERYKDVALPRVSRHSKGYTIV